MPFDATPIESKPDVFSLDGLIAWLSGAARAVARVYGRFPTDRAQIVVVPVPGDDIVFGYAGSGGGPSVVILAGTQAGARAPRRSVTPWPASRPPPRPRRSGEASSRISGSGP